MGENEREGEEKTVPAEGAEAEARPVGASESEGESEGEGESESESESESETRRPPPKAGWRANLAVLALVPFAALAGALAHPDHRYHRDLTEDVVIGAGVGIVVGLIAALFVRLAHRWATEWLAVLAGGGVWILTSVVADLGSRPHLWQFSSRAEYHAACVGHSLEMGNFGASSASLVLGGVALALALLLESRHDAAQRPLSRAALALSFLPVALTALAAAYAADMWGFALIAIVLVFVAALRVASRVALREPRSLALALGSVLAGAGALAAAASGAVTHALALAMDTLTHSRSPAHVLAAVGRIGGTRAAAGAPVLALLPLVGLAFAAEGRARVGLPKRALVLSVAALGLLLWLDARNLADVRDHVRAYASVTGADDLALPVGDFQLPTLDAEDTVSRRFVVVPSTGPRWYLGHALPPGVPALRALSRRGPPPPVLADRRTSSAALLALVAAVGGSSAVPFVGLSSDGTHLREVALGPALSAPSGGGDQIRLYLLLQEDGTCVIASTAGERIEMPGCDSLRERLEERRAVEPNRHDIILAAERDVTLEQILGACVMLEETGFDTRYIVDGAWL